MVTAVRAVRMIVNFPSREFDFSVKYVNFANSVYDDVGLEQLNAMKELSESINSLEKCFHKLSVDSPNFKVLHKLFQCS